MYEEILYTPGGMAVNFIPNVAIAVTPSDTAILQPGILFIGGAGDVVVMPEGLDTFVTFKSIAAGTFLPIYVKAVHTGTSASDILICY